MRLTDEEFVALHEREYAKALHNFKCDGIIRRSEYSLYRRQWRENVLLRQYPYVMDQVKY